MDDHAQAHRGAAGARRRGRLAAASRLPRGDTGGGGGGGRGGIPIQYWNQLRSKDSRDPRGYIIPSDQPDFPTATKFVNALLKAGVVVDRATADFTVAGKRYPAGSYVIQAAQAFRPHLRDMLEPQDHPNDFQYPGGPPKPPYDITGYTLAFQMGVQFDRILDGFEGPFQKIDGLLKPPAGKVTAGNAAGYLLSHQMNDAFTGTTRLLAAGRRCLLAEERVHGRWQDLSRRNHLHPAKAIHGASVRDAGLGTWAELHGHRHEAAGRSVQTAARARRAVGPLRRVAGFRAHPLDVRAGISHTL